MGTTEIELVPSGHCLGSAAMALGIGSHRVFYAGAINPWMPLGSLHPDLLQLVSLGTGDQLQQIWM